jgi:glycosyltransferase involved in cell wall biosynthesis
MPDAPLVTVIIATYNKREALRYAIDSVLWQTMGDFELLVIGDACSDGSEQLVESYQDARVHWYNLPTNSGYQSEPNNEGLRRARGTYIAYLNHDDIWLPRHLETLVREIREKNADLAFSILEWVMSWKDNYPDIPDYPQAPTVPPQARRDDGSTAQRLLPAGTARRQALRLCPHADGAEIRCQRGWIRERQPAAGIHAKGER